MKIFKSIVYAIVLIISLFVGIGNVFASTPALFEYYNTGGDGGSTNISITQYVAQTFTVNGSHTITSVRLPIKRNGGDFGSAYVSIRQSTNASATGTPTGLDLAYGYLSYSGISTSGYSWYNFALNTELSVNAGGYYSIVVYTTYGDPTTNNLQWQKETAGAYAGGGSCNSTNGGVTWVSEASDYLFEVWGNGSIIVSNACVVKDYTSTSSGDWMIFCEIDNTFASLYNANVDPSQYYQLQLLDGATIKAVSVEQYWQKQPMAIYISSALASSLNWGNAYTLRLTDNTTTYYFDYTLQSTDWKGTLGMYIDQWIRLVAHDLETYYSKTYLVSTTSGIVLNVDGGVIFSRNIPSLPNIRPNMFQLISINPATGLTNATPTNALQAEHTWSTMIGATLTNTLTTASEIMGLTSGKDVGAGFFWLAWLLVGAMVFGAGHMSSGMGIGLPILGIGVWLGFIDVVWVLLPLGLILVMFGLQKFIDRTG